MFKFPSVVFVVEPRKVSEKQNMEAIWTAISPFEG